MKQIGDKAMSRHRTLGWIAETAFLAGNNAATIAFESIAPDSLARRYQVIRPEEGQPSLRTEVDRDRDGIDYVSFSPPAAWEPRYAVALVNFQHKLKDDFMSHSGEELIFPVEGAITYHFYWPGEKGGVRPKVDVLKTPFRPRSLARINPQVPHHTWATTEQGGRAWMIFHHSAEVTTASLLDADPESAHKPPTSPHRIDQRRLDDPGRYALIAWGIAEKIRLARVRANLNFAQLAQDCNVDASLLSRLENAEGNVSIDALVRIAHYLRIDLHQLIAPALWTYEHAPFPKVARNAAEPAPLLKKARPHVVHPLLWSIAANKQVHPQEAHRQPSNGISSWIVLEGRVVVDLPDGVAPEILSTGTVLHMRDAKPAQLQALDDTTIVQIYYSEQQCFCKAEHV